MTFLGDQFRVIVFQLRFVIPVLVIAWLDCSLIAQEDAHDANQPASQVPTIDQYAPNSMLKVKRTDLVRSKFPVIDIHGHFGFRLKGNRESLNKYVGVMDRQNIAMAVSLDAALGNEEEHLKFLAPHLERFLVFCHIDFVGKGSLKEPKSLACNQPNFVRDTCQQLKTAKRKGIVGLKFFKQFGLGFKNANGSLIRIDDTRFDPIWRTCADLDFPVLIHTADPAAFFDPIDNKNERYEELLRHPEWSFFGEPFPSRQELLNARNNVVRRHPDTVFVGAHVANNSEDLAQVDKWLDLFPNLYVEISSRISELGRQPFSARKFFIRHQDRVLFGTDGPWPEERLTFYWRFLETHDEYFRYSEKTPQPQGLWHIYGVRLPDPILEKIYYKNALKLLPGSIPKFEAIRK